MLAMEEHMSEGTGHGIITTTAKQFARHRSHLATTDHASCCIHHPSPTAIASSDAPTTPSKKQTYKRVVVAAITIILAIALYLIWRSPATPTPASITQQTLSSVSSNSPTDTSGVIQVYIVGAVKHPGVYTLPADARVYQLLQAAGGPLPNANLVALNMAAKLSDGQEVYVTVVGEVPPTYLGGVPGTNPNTANSGTLVNINTASMAEMRQVLHISAATAQKIIDYRVQHGNYTSVDQLLQVVSRSIYDKIRKLVTV